MTNTWFEKSGYVWIIVLEVISIYYKYIFMLTDNKCPENGKWCPCYKASSRRRGQHD